MIRKVKRLGEYIDNCRIVDGSVKQDDLFAKIKKSRRDKTNVKVSVDGKTGRGVADLFADRYEDLFNSCNNEEKIRESIEELDEALKKETPEDAMNLINDSVIGEAISRLKKDKADPYTDITTTSIKEGSELLVAAISQFFRACASHGYFPGELLIAKSIPLV